MEFVPITIVWEDSPLGIQLKTCVGGKGAYIDSLEIFSPIEAPSPLRIGDLLSKIGSDIVEEYSIQSIFQKLQNVERPVSLTFLRFQLSTSTLSPTSSTPTIQSLDELTWDFRNYLWFKKYLKAKYPENTLALTRRIALWNKLCSCRTWLKCLESLLFLTNENIPMTLLTRIEQFLQMSTKKQTSPYIRHPIGYVPYSTTSSADTMCTSLKICLKQCVESLESNLFDFLQSDMFHRMNSFYIRQYQFIYYSVADLLLSESGRLVLYSILPRK
jgi:hypothetical protein